jgi:AAA family ATP:ADP antiporter
MVFITMNKEEKEAGKAAVDVLGNQIGKTGGSWVMQVQLRTSLGGCLLACDAKTCLPALVCCALSCGSTAVHLLKLRMVGQWCLSLRCFSLRCKLLAVTTLVALTCGCTVC